MITHQQKFAFSIPETVQMTSIGRSRIYEDIRCGKLKVAKIGRRTVVPVAALNEWLAAHMSPQRAA